MNYSLRNILLLLLFFVGLTGEVLLETFCQGCLGDYKSPVVWLLSGLLSVFAAWGLLISRPDKTPSLHKESFLHKKTLASFTLFMCAAIFFGFQLSEIFAKFEVSQYNSDVVPSIQMYVRRLLSGEYPYTPLVFDGWTVLPTYFPMMWLPYIFSEVLNIDYRWTAYLVFLSALILYQFRMYRQDIPLVEMIIKTLLPFLILLPFTFYNEIFFGHSVELLPIGFYLFLYFGFFNKNKPLLFATGIVFCLLSRYAFTLWLPLSMLIYWNEYGFKAFFRVSLYVLMGVMIIYVIPFLSQDFSLVTNGLKYYELTAIRQWEPQAWQAVGEKPHHLFQGLSFSAWFYNNVEGDALAKMNAARTVHGIVSVGAAALLGIGYLLIKRFRTQWNIRLYLLVGLKFYLLFFYGFIYVPFSYLFVLPTLLSIGIVYEMNIWDLIQSKDKKMPI